MSVIPVDEPDSAGNGAVKPGGFRRRLAQALDEYFVNRMKRAVPEIALRRSKQDINRFRRLMHKSSMAPAEANISRASRRHATQTQSQ